MCVERGWLSTGGSLMHDGARKKIAVLMGGRSSEREVSLVSGSAVARAIDQTRYHVIPVHITQRGSWERMESLYDQDHLIRTFHDALKPTRLPYIPYSDLGGAIEILETTDIVFPVLHGPYGEDGTIQGFLETAGMPYVGGGVLFHSVCMDKPLLKSLLMHEGIPTPRFVCIREAEWHSDSVRQLEMIQSSLTLPVFVKPAALGSSVGISKVTESNGLREAIIHAFQFGNRVIVEQGIEGREIECSVMGNEDPVVSTVFGEIKACNEFYDYEAKYVKDSTLIIPAPDIDEVTMERIRMMAAKAFKIAGGAGYARIDFLLGSEGPMLNEINTIPGFTEISMFPRLFMAEGMTFGDIVNRLIELGLARFRNQIQTREKT